MVTANQARCVPLRTLSKVTDTFSFRSFPLLLRYYLYLCSPKHNYQPFIMKKFYLMLFAGSLAITALAQEKFESGRPNNADYRYLDGYKALKEYIDYSKYPNFKLGIGTSVPEYLQKSTVYKLTNKNFTETVAGNAMKMTSCVNGNGDMNFETVKKYVKEATDAGLSVYGHTLAWHSQQPIGWLTKLIAGPLTQQEKHDALVNAMDRWIKGMMEACDGKVKAWDLVNEAIGGNPNDVDAEGYFNLQNAKQNNSGSWDVGGDKFYWQDYMGSLEYVRQACRLARKYGPKDIVLFINDYNLESDWDDNKKLKSLIHWIKKWEADGETKIDGIGTQMHVNYYENSNLQKSSQEHITKMFELMAASGKWVRVSEMDMGYVRGSNKWVSSVKTYQLTETEHKKMADFYEWIIKEFFRIVPAAQQWGICQWCPTDAPDTQYMWRRNEPVGIWDLSYYRKHVYAGFVRGLNGGEPTAINKVMTDEAIDKIDTSKGIYNLQGVRMQATSLNELPAGLYIVNGKKVMIRTR